MTSVYREKSFSLQGDSKMIEEKLDQVSDLKTQIRCLINDNEEVKLNQEELNANMATVTHQMSLLADAFEKLGGSGRTDIFRRVSRLSRQSFRNKLPNAPSTNGQQQLTVTPTTPLTPKTPTTPLSPKSPSTLLNPPLKRKASLEGIVKQLTSLAVSISTDDVKGTVQSEAETRLLAEHDRRGSGTSLPGRLIDKKLKRTNLMKRRESQALLEGIRKSRGAQINAESGHTSNDNS